MEIMPARVPRDMVEDVVGRNGTRGKHASLAEPRGQLPTVLLSGQLARGEK
jgi:hypothetical protein